MSIKCSYDAHQSGGTTSATIRWCNGASPEVLRKKHLFPKGLLKKKNQISLTGVAEDATAVTGITALG